MKSEVKIKALKTQLLMVASVCMGTSCQPKERKKPGQLYASSYQWHKNNLIAGWETLVKGLSW